MFMKKRMLASFLCAAIALSAMAGCSNGGVSSSSSGTMPSSTEPASKSSSEAASSGTNTAAAGAKIPDNMTKLTVELFDRANTPESEGTLENNQWTNWIKEEMAKRNVDVTFVPVPRGEETTKLNVLLASNNAPDISFTYDRLLFTKYASDGGLTKLDEYMDTYGKDIAELFEPEKILDYGRIGDDLYAIPARRASTTHYMSFIRKDWLDQLGVAVPKTKEELVNALQAFKGMDSTILPWGMFPGSPGGFTCHDFYPYDAMYSFFERSDEQDYSTPEVLRTGFQEFMQWMNSLYAQGLIDPEFSTKTGDMGLADGLNNKVGFFIEGEWTQYGTDSKAVYRHLLETTPEAEYVPVECFENADGHYYKTNYPPIGLYLFVPLTCKNPEAAITYLNWMADEDVAWKLSYGNEGVQYDMVDGIPKIKDLDQWQNTFGYLAGDIKLLYNGDPIMSKETEMAILRDKAGSLGDFAVACKELAAKDGMPEKLFNKELESEKKYSAEIDNTYKEYWTKLLTTKDFEGDYQKFMDELKSKGIDEIVAERTEYYHSVVKDQ